MILAFAGSGVFLGAPEDDGEPAGGCDVFLCFVPGVECGSSLALSAASQGSFAAIMLVTALELSVVIWAC